MDKLRQMQLCELEMLKEVDRLAEKYHLSYNMAYGTFLGAVRHKGFIPWDDDLDISMPLSDVKKLEAVWKKEFGEKFFLQTPHTDIAPFPFYKIRRNHTLMLDVQLKHLQMHHGVWIDIFPYVRAAKSRAGKKFQVLCLKNIGRIRARYYNQNSKNPVRRIISKLPKGIFNALDDLLLKLLEAAGSKKSGQYFELSKYDKEEHAFVEEELFNKRIRYPFENGFFWGSEDYHAYLTKYYGENYMTPVRYSHITDLNNIQFFEEEES